MSQTATTLVEVRPIRPFVGSYKCTIDECDYIQDILIEKDGFIVKGKEPRKRFIGMIGERRPLTGDEIMAAKSGALGPRYDVEARPEDLKQVGVGTNSLPTIYGTVRPRQAAVRVPVDIADDLVRRGLAEIIEPAKAAKQPKGG